MESIKLVKTTQERIETFDRMMFPTVTEDFKNWLIERDFFTAPASIHHHGRYEGALFDHSYVVANVLVYLTNELDLKWEREQSPVIVGMFHDLCKVSNYKRNKSAENKITYPEFDEVWNYNNAQVLTGHGEKSVMMLQQHMCITDEELLCIRWHMGAFEGEAIYNNYGQAINTCPNVLWTHTADMVAARIYGV